VSPCTTDAIVTTTSPCTAETNPSFTVTRRRQVFGDPLAFTGAVHVGVAASRSLKVPRASAGHDAVT